MSAVEKAWHILKTERIQCDFCGKEVNENEIAASSSSHGPTKPRWEACHGCVSSGKVVDNDGKEVR